MTEGKTQPTGIYPDMTNEEYHSIDAVSNSYLKTFGTVNPAAARVPRQEKYVFAEGQAMHMLSLEGEELFKESVIEAACGPTAAKYQATVLANPGQIVLAKGGIELCYRCRDAIYKHPTARQWLDRAKGVAETSAFMRDKTTGLLCKCRPDWIMPEEGMLVDLKFMRDGGSLPHKWMWSLKDGYAQQAGWYTTIYSAAARQAYDKFVFIVCEKSEDTAFAVACYDTPGEWIDWGWEEQAIALRKEADCRTNNFWPNYRHAGVDVVDFPEYLKHEL